MITVTSGSEATHANGKAGAWGYIFLRHEKKEKRKVNARARTHTHTHTRTHAHTHARTHTHTHTHTQLHHRKGNVKYFFHNLFLQLVIQNVTVYFDIFKIKRQKLRMGLWRNRFQLSIWPQAIEKKNATGVGETNKASCINKNSKHLHTCAC
jgi:hypothetical protein